MDDDDLPPKPHPRPEGAAGAFGQLIGALLWIGIFLVLAGVVLYVVSRATG
ncbi:MAG TPA: hypothetical protein VIJ85_14270 [Rhizomicrobium sp.]